MPFYLVRTSHTTVREFVIEAADRGDATTLALAYHDPDPAPVSGTAVQTRMDTDTNVSATDGTQKDMTNATRNKKGK